MINPKHLETLVAIAEQGSFSAAGEAIGRSHSAVSLHIKALEEDVGVPLVDRSQRPPVLTPEGEAMAEQARRMRRVLQDIEAIGRQEQVVGRLGVGIVPSAMATLAAPALARLRSAHPDLQLEIRTGLSGELAQAVRSGDLDVALVTAPDLPPEDLDLKPVADEPLVVIAPPETKAATDAEMLRGHPFIWFSRKTWAGQQIERRLLDRGLRVRAAMEIDSLEAIEALVRHGLGVSVVPASSVGPEVVQTPFCEPQAVRRVVLAARPRSPKVHLIEALRTAFTDSGT
ncbi:MAG: LysR family transcriptional regulator [Pseudomonadota bacterium]